MIPCAGCPNPVLCTSGAIRCWIDTLPTTPETPTMDTNPKAARAVADGKLRLELIETALTHPVARVMAHGAEKYGVRNWRTQPIYLRTYLGALRRHTDALADGQWLDPDSGEPHLAHIAACAQVVLDAQAHGTLTDDHDYAEAGVPGGVAANVEGGVKLTEEYERGQDELAEELAQARIGPPCPADGLPCYRVDGCTTPCPKGRSENEAHETEEYERGNENETHDTEEYAARIARTKAGRAQGVVCGLAVRNGDPSAAWLSSGCFSEPCCAADFGCPGPQPQSALDTAVAEQTR